MNQLPWVYVIGDSISIQYGPYLEHFMNGTVYYSRKQGKQEVLLNLDNPRGANGGDSAQVAEFLTQLLVTGFSKIDLLLVNCGLHDIKRNPTTGRYQVPIDEYEQNLERIVSYSKELSHQMIWVRTTPVDDPIHNSLSKVFFRYNEDCINYNRVADGIMANHGIESIDLYEFTDHLPHPKYCDHVHFTEEVRKLQGEIIGKRILETLKR
jgi:lysophospholipase L1-like esterase